jgi:hypothetical protein
MQLVLNYRSRGWSNLNSATANTTTATATNALNARCTVKNLQIILLQFLSFYWINLKRADYFIVLNPQCEKVLTADWLQAQTASNGTYSN